MPPLGLRRRQALGADDGKPSGNDAGQALLGAAGQGRIRGAHGFGFRRQCVIATVAQSASEAGPMPKPEDRIEAS